MFTRCLVCGGAFPGNETLEHVPRGDRIAYDPSRGRLWTVCRACKRWSLAPIEERWEALEEIEKLVTDRSRLLSQTDNVALLRAGDLDIVRVGRAGLAEESWWRYGRELRERRMSYKKISAVGTVAAGAVVLGGWATGGLSLVGAWFIWGSNPPGKLTHAARWLRFGTTAWRGHATCERCGWIFRDLRFRDRQGLVLLPGRDEDEPEVGQPCPRCRADDLRAHRAVVGGERRGDAGLVLRGREAEMTLRRVLAYHHFEGASEERVRAATRLIEEAGTPRHLERLLIRDGRALGELQRTGAVALEIAVNEASEQRLLELELAELDAHWRHEEELASIIDGELTPLPLLEQVRRSVAGRG